MKEALQVLADIESKLRNFWEDHRLFEIWAEYYTAIQLKERNPEWRISVSPNMRDDVICDLRDNKK